MKRLTRQYLEQFGWCHVGVGSSIVSFCDNCVKQRTHICTSRVWEDTDYVYDFDCDHCVDREMKKHVH